MILEGKGAFACPTLPVGVTGTVGTQPNKDKTRGLGQGEGRGGEGRGRGRGAGGSGRGPRRSCWHQLGEGP